MKLSNLFLTNISVAAALLTQQLTAHADPITGSLTAQYFEVAATPANQPDFGTYNTTPQIAIGSALGTNGLPVLSNPASAAMVDPVTHELTWWSPTLNPAVTSTGTFSASIPYGSNMYAPNSTGSSDASLYETAIFSGTFSTTAAGANFTVSSDDDSYIYVNGILVGQNAGIHPVTGYTFTAGGEGVNTIEIFYADRETTGASFSISGDGVTFTSAVPEPSTWAMMMLGFAGLGFMAYRRRDRARLA